MNLPGTIDVAIGLGFVYFLFSLVCSKINEAVASALKMRAKGLEMGLRRLIVGTAGGGVPEAVAGSRVTYEAFQARLQAEQPTDRPPSYLRPAAFSSAVYDLLTPSLTQLLTEIYPLAAGNDAALRILNDSSKRAEEMVAALGALQPPPGGELGKLTAEAVGALNARDPLAQARAAVANLPVGHPAKAPLERFLKVAGADRDRFLGLLEGWFNGAMDRLSGWYKRRTQLFLMIYAVLLVLAFNIDSIHLATTLYRNGPLSAAVAGVAERSTDVPSAQQAIRDATDLGLPLGWTRKPSAGAVDPSRQFPTPTGEVPVKLLGFALTVGALALGSTFWFDLLGKVANLRNAGPKPQTAN